MVVKSIPEIPISGRVYTFFTKVFCINISRRADRWEAFRRRFEASGWPFIEIERFEAVDGSRVPAPAWFRGGNGAWGCLQSHLRILERAMMAGWESVLILEDDAAPCENFYERAAAFVQTVPEDWDQIYLGGQHLHYSEWPRTHRPRYVSQEVIRAKNVNRTHGHAIHRRFMKTVYRHLTDYASHLENPAFHVDHRLGQLHDTGQYRIYAPRHWLLGQAEGLSDVSGRLESVRFFEINEDVVDLPEQPAEPAFLSLESAVERITEVGLRRTLLRALSLVAEHGHEKPTVCLVHRPASWLPAPEVTALDEVLNFFIILVDGVRVVEPSGEATDLLMVASPVPLSVDAAPRWWLILDAQTCWELIETQERRGYRRMMETVGFPSCVLLQRN